MAPPPHEGVVCIGDGVGQGADGEPAGDTEPVGDPGVGGDDADARSGEEGEEGGAAALGLEPLAEVIAHGDSLGESGVGGVARGGGLGA